MLNWYRCLFTPFLSVFDPFFFIFSPHMSVFIFSPHIKEKLNEHHILFQCHFLRRLHERYGLAKYKQDHSQLEISQIYKKFWTDDLSSDVILGRVESADAIRQAYIGAMKTLLRP